MPWKIETPPDQQREDFVREALRQEKPFKELCQQHRISRKTGYKWLKRSGEEGSKSLGDRRRGPRQQIPSRATISRILKQAGLVTAQRRTRQKVGPEHPDCTRLAPVWCNDVWGVDFKGWFYTGDGHKCYPLTISDLYSRYIICCEDLASMALPAV